LLSEIYFIEIVDKIRRVKDLAHLLTSHHSRQPQWELQHQPPPTLPCPVHFE